jgi:hypothetical protein
MKLFIMLIFFVNEEKWDTDQTIQMTVHIVNRTRSYCTVLRLSDFIVRLTCVMTPFHELQFCFFRGHFVNQRLWELVLAVSF